MEEFDRKQKQIQDLLVEHKADALLLQRASSFAWATCGASSYINTASTEGLASLLITADDRYLITTNIEATRLDKEEGLVQQGWELQAAPWYETVDTVGKLVKGGKLAVDGPHPGAVDLSAQVSALRTSLGAEEVARFRILGKLCAAAMDEAIRKVRPGMSEFEIAGLLAGAAESRGVQAIVNLVATDERIYQYRHPLPTEKTMDRYAMIVLCGRRWGLVCSITRLVHFGRIEDELLRKQEAVASVDAVFINSTRPGAKLGDVFSKAVATYEKFGFGDEWRLHHQGGPAAYEPREWIATLASTDLVITNQAYAWNPSITGTKSEDTILVGEDGNEVLTVIDGWPNYAIQAAGKEINRPVILEIVE